LRRGFGRIPQKERECRHRDACGGGENDGDALKHGELYGAEVAIYGGRL